MRSDDGKMIEVHGDSDLAFEALVQLASEAIQEPGELF